MKCVECKASLPKPFKVVPGKLLNGSGIKRGKSVAWCESCWNAAQTLHQRTREQFISEQKELIMNALRAGSITVAQAEQLVATLERQIND